MKTLQQNSNSNRHSYKLPQNTAKPLEAAPAPSSYKLLSAKIKEQFSAIAKKSATKPKVI